MVLFPECPQLSGEGVLLPIGAMFTEGTHRLNITVTNHQPPNYT